MELKIVTPPAVEPVSLTEAKLHLRVDHSTDDALITALITAAREYVENYLSGSLVEQTRAMYLSAWPYYPLRLPGGPVQEITSVKYTDSAGVEQTVSTSVYYLTPGGEISRKPDQAWPTTRLYGAGAIKITYTTGYAPVVTVIPGEEEGDPDTEETDYDANIPQAIKQAMLLLIGEWYEQREAATEKSPQTIPYGVHHLLTPYREVPL